MAKQQYEIVVKSIGEHCRRYVIVSDENNIDYALGEVRKFLIRLSTKEK
jgi:hypothetical protein